MRGKAASRRFTGLAWEPGADPSGLGPAGGGAGTTQAERSDLLGVGQSSSLAHCYWNWGLLERAFGNTTAEQAKLSSALTLFRELGMPRERDAVEAALTKSRSAGNPLNPPGEQCCHSLVS
jgi:hypothetical protein